MKKDISSILSECCAQYGTSMQKALNKDVSTERVEKSRMLFIYVVSAIRCPIGRSGALVGWDLTDTKANIVAAGNRYKTDFNFKRRADVVLASLYPPKKTETTETTDNNKKMGAPFYTKEEEEAMRNACTEATRFMESYGLPRDDGSVRHAVRNGIGYYPEPLTFDR